MNRLALDVVLIVVCFLIGAVFSAAEMALVSLREPQIASFEQRGRRGRAIADLARNPNRFLSAGQIGATLAGFLSASFGASTLASHYTSPLLMSWGLGATAADIISLVLITAVISFFSIIISELTAKRLAMQRPEAFASGLAPIVNWLATLFRPIIWLLDVCTNALVRLLGGDPGVGKYQVTNDELRVMLTTSATLGQEERHIVDEVFEAGDHSLREVMVPRTEVQFLSAEMTAGQALALVRDAPYSRYPVVGASKDQVLGFLHLRDLAGLDEAAAAVPIRKLVRPVVFLPETVLVMRALADMRRAHAHLAVVVDEYGGTAGIVTFEDLVEELIGDITDEYDVVPPATQASGEFAGLTTLDEFAEATGYLLPEGPYDTLAGYFTAQLGELAKVGDTVDVELEPLSPGDHQDGEPPGPAALTMRVEAMDQRRIERLSVHPATGQPI